MALPKNLQIQRQNQSGALGRLGAINEIVDEVAILHDIQLEPERPGCNRCDVFDRADAHRRQSERNAKFFSRLRCQHFAIRVLHACQTGRCQRDGHRNLLANHGAF